MMTIIGLDKVKEIYDIVVDYSGYSTLVGLIYVFMPKVPPAGKVFWSLWIILMLGLGTYWSWWLYNDWQRNPVLTTVTTTALPVSQVPFPALTICSEGYNFDVYDASLFKIFFDFVTSSGGPEIPWTPLEAAIVNNRQFFTNLTEAENVTATQINYLQEQFWPQFSNANYPVSAVDDPRNWIKWSNVNSIDWYIIMLNQASPERFMMDYAIQDRCLSITNITCFEVVMAPIIGDITKIAMEDYLNYSKYLVNQTDFTAGFKVAFSSLWHAKLPCFDTRGISAFEEGEKGILKQCKWKGKIVPCSGIFTTFPTDRGMCCSFNMKAANEIFADSQYSSLVTQLQYEDFSTSFENSTLPDWFIKSNEPTSQPGKNMGLEIILDAHSDILESQSVNSDFEGLTGLITDSESFPMTDLRGFDIKAGHINHVAISAVQIGADDKLRTLESVTRKCLYPDEIESLKLFKTYSQANCFLECNLKFAQKQLAIEQNLTQGCTPWSFPFVNDNFKMCDPFQTEDVRYMMKNVPSEECSHCLPDCIRTMYDQKVTSQPFRRCDERNFFVTEFCTVDIGNRFEPPIWARHFIETFIKTQGKIPSYISNLQSSKRTIKVPYYYSNFFEGLSQDYEAYEKDIAVLKVFFDSTTVMLYETQPTQSWIDYFSAVGGALGLCIGLSIMTVIEIIWLCFRICGLVQNKEDSNEVKNLQ